ncbi:MAG: DUF3891 family protein [Pirellulales bacterium]
MIRRDCTFDDASAWAIIPQLAHARLAGRLAEMLDVGRFPLLATPQLRPVLLDAVRRHDDGWAPWDPYLQVDPQSGAPRQFTEMLPGELRPIWLRSIVGVGTTNPLGGHIVARHFAALLGHHLASLPEASNERKRGELFAGRLDRLAAAYLAEWQETSPRLAGEAELPDHCLRFLQAMDYLSLWLCCHERPEPLDLEIDGTATRFTSPEPGHVVADPWPARQSSWACEARGQVMPAGQYRCNGELAAARSRPVTLSWRFTPQ